MTPDFTDAAHTNSFKLSSEWATILASNGRDSVVVADPQFNTGVQKKLVCAVRLTGKNQKHSPYVQTFFTAGMNRPANPIVLTAKAVSPTQVLLSWHPVGNVSAIRFWYSTTGKIPGNQTEFPSPPYDSISTVSVIDTVDTIRVQHDNTTYYFAGQVFSGGLWSFVDTTGASATTPLASGKLPVNSVKITSCVFDTTDNSIHVSWTVDNTLPDPLEIGISYSLRRISDHRHKCVAYRVRQGRVRHRGHQAPRAARVQRERRQSHVLLCCAVGKEGQRHAHRSDRQLGDTRWRARRTTGRQSPFSPHRRET